MASESDKIKKRDLLDRDIRYLKGVGPKKQALFKRIGVKTVKDLLFLAPRRYEDRTKIVSISDVIPGEFVTIKGRITLRGRRRLYGKEGFGIIVDDGTGWIEVVFFVKNMQKLFRIGDEIIISGKVEFDKYYNKPIFVHPEYAIIGKNNDDEIIAGMVIPIYPQTEGLDSRFIRKLIYELLKEDIHLTDYVPEVIRKKERLYPLGEAISKMHFPDSVLEGERARKVIAFNELFQFFYKINIKKEDIKRAYPFKQKGELSLDFIKKLPFSLTLGQKKVIEEIDKDLEKSVPMQRLLQGDVGSGKTVIAIYTMLRAVENGMQAAFMAPTETLADQVFLVLSNFISGLPLKMELLKSSTRPAKRRQILGYLSNGDIDILVGTHALLTENVNFYKLGLIVIDEQHKFGVLQRYNLWKKGDEFTPHLLLMTATPIPRSLALTLYGNLELSLLTEKPPGRGKIETVVKVEKNRDEVYRWVFKKVEHGEKAYIVVPFIEESDFTKKQGMKDLYNMYEYLNKMKSDGVRIGLLHGRMKPLEKRSVMEKFRDGEFNVLLSTTVIEVGIDVKDATLMVIEHADRFGLAQLHQLRGRVGRGKKKSFCILIMSENTSQEGMKRIKALKMYDSGFDLAEFDLKMRGPGEILGTKQHGFSGFRVFHFYKDQDIIEKVRDYVKLVQNGKLPLSQEEKNKLISLREKLKEAYYVA